MIDRYLCVYTLPSYVPKGGCSALIFDESFLISSNVTIEELRK